MHSLNKSSLRYIIRHPWQFGLSVLGIALGVAIVVSIDIANHSSGKAFSMSMEAVAGKATHRITGPSQGIPDSFYTNLRIQHGIKNIAPVIESYVKIGHEGKKIFKLLGVDFFAERPFRDYLSQNLNDIDGELSEFLTRKNTIVLSPNSLTELSASIGDSVAAVINGRTVHVHIIGTISSQANNKSFLENLLITDIASAQALSGKMGRIDYIDVIIENPAQEQRLRDLLPEGYELQNSTSRSQTAEQMLQAFNINLTALSLLALIVGIFLIYNTMTFSVIQRKVLIGTLRSIGVTANEITGMILKEALLIAVIGTAAGFAMAYFISKYLLIIISQTINDLYFVVAVREIYITPFIVAKGIALGLAATVLSALKPANEAALVHPRAAMLRSEQERSLLKRVPVMSGTGIILILAGAVALIIPSKNIWFSYAGILPVIIGFALLTPLMIIFVEKISSPLFKHLFGITGKLASRSVLQNISRTYIAIAALALAVAATVGVGTMTSSFRNTVVQWLESRLDADLFVTAPSMISRRNDAVIPKKLLADIRALKEVRAVNFYRELELFQQGERIHLVASGLNEASYAGFRFKEGNPDEVWPRYNEGDILVTEPFAYRNNLSLNSKLWLKTDSGMREFTIAGIYYDYASDQGLVSIHYDHFTKHWNSQGVSGISVFVDERYTLELVKQKIQAINAGSQELLVRTFRYIRDTSIEIFDRTFIIANVLQLLAIIVAFIGILSSLMSLQLERNKELGILRANGLLPVQLFKIVTIQTFLIGVTAGLLALPLGKVLAAILVFIINKRSFGWTMQFEIMPAIMLEAILLAVLAALLAGIYPGLKMSQASPAQALRSE